MRVALMLMLMFLGLRRLSGCRCRADLIGIVTGKAFAHGIAQLPQRELRVFPCVCIRGNLIEMLMQGHAKLHERLRQCVFQMILGFVRHAQSQRTGGFGDGGHIILRQCSYNLLRACQQSAHFLQDMPALRFGEHKYFPAVFICCHG